MTTDAERLLSTLCDPMTTTAEATGFFGVDMLALSVAKPSRDDHREPDAEQQRVNDAKT